MKQIIPTERKSTSILNLALGHSLIVISLYVIYRVSAFVISQIVIPPGIENLGFATFTISLTLLGTGALLRLDMKPIRKAIPLRQKVAINE